MPEDTSSPSLQMPETASSVGGAPSAAGMMTPQAPEGEIEAAKLDAYHVCRLIDRAVAKIGRKSKFTDALLRARATITGEFGEFEEDSQKFSDAELKRMLLTLAGPGQPAQQQAPPGQQQPPGGQQPQAGGAPGAAG